MATFASASITNNKHNMHPRRRIGFMLLIVIGLVLGYFIKNIKAGLIIGLAIGLLAGSLGSKRE